jgi:hypothetical protein
MIIDLRLRNIAATQASGLDAAFGQSLRTPWGEVRWNTIATYLMSFTQANSSTQPAMSLLATAGNPPRLRLRSATDWYQHAADLPGLAAGVVINHMSRFQDGRDGSDRSVRASTVWDLHVSYRTGRNGGGWSDDLEFALAVSNVINDDPPFLNHYIGYDTANAEPIGRVLMVSLQKSF